MQFKSALGRKGGNMPATSPSAPFIAAVFALGCAGPAIAEPQDYRLDGDHTHIVWEVDRFGFTSTVGTFTDVTGRVVLDEAHPERSSVEVTIALSGLRSDLAEREDIVRGPYWLDAEAHPAIRFTSTSVSVSDSECDGRCLRVTGNMSLKGITAPLSLEVRINKVAPDPVSRRKAAGFSASGAFDRTVFGIDTAVGPIGKTVSFEIEALAIAGETDNDG